MPGRFIDLSQPWAIEERAARFYLGAYQSILARKASGVDYDQTRAESDSGKVIGSPRSYSVENGVAVIPINGPLLKHADLLDAISGAADYQSIQHDLAQAVNDTKVDCILLDINSPGGMVAGVAACAAAIRAASTTKPVVAFADGIMASAAYYLASAANEIVIDRAAIIGSIGTMMAWLDPAKMLENMGIEEVTFIASQSPMKNADHNTPDGAAQYQGIVDNAAAAFIADVAKYRGVSVDTVKQEFGQGAVFTGKAGVKAGLADRLGTLDGVKQQLASGKYQPPERMMPGKKPGQNKAATTATGGIDMKWKDFKAMFKDENREGEPEAVATPPAPAATPPEPAPVAQAAPVTVGGMTEAEVEALKTKAAVLDAQVAEAEAAVLQARTNEAVTFAENLAANIAPVARDGVIAALRDLHLAGHGATVEMILAAPTVAHLKGAVLSGEQLKDAAVADPDPQKSTTEKAVKSVTKSNRALPGETVKRGG